MSRISVSPYVFPGLKLDLKEKRKIQSESRLNGYRLSKDEILLIIAEENGVTVNDIVKRSRKREIVNARFMFCGIVKDYFDYSLVKIGEFIDNRDHTSVIHGITEFKYRVQSEEPFRNIVNRIYNKIGVGREI
jgi:chromosomal replication initiator protein